MLTPFYTSQFNKDVKKVKKSGNKNIHKFIAIIQKLINEEKLEPQYKDHILSGNFKSYKECHIEPDWLLIYKIESKNIFFTRTGSHSELFS